MKIVKVAVVALLSLLSFNTGIGQDTNLASGDLSILKGEKTINVQFLYDKVGVGDYSKESDYVKNKTAEMNAKEAKSGDAWAVRWNDAKDEFYHPKFIESFTKYSEMTIDTAAKYTLIFKVTFIEPGYQVAISKKAAQVEGTITLVPTENKTKKLAMFSVERGGGYFRGGSFDFAGRIAEAYAVTGKKTGTLISKAVK
jgi:hypothetical protein